MSFATATIQGFVTWKSSLQQTPSGRNVVNMIVSVPDKKKETSTSYKISIWDKQAGYALEYISVKQLITAQGQLSLEHYPSKDTILRLDFASILDYGRLPNTENKSSFGVKIDKENVKKVTEKMKKVGV